MDNLLLPLHQNDDRSCFFHREKHYAAAVDLNDVFMSVSLVVVVVIVVQSHAMIEQLWSKCRLRIVSPNRVYIKIQLFLGWKARTILIFILPLVFLFGVR